MDQKIGLKGFQLQRFTSDFLTNSIKLLLRETPLSTTPGLDETLQSISEEYLESNIGNDFFGTSNKLQQFIFDLVNYNFCGNNKMVEFYQVFEVCKQYFPDQTYQPEKFISSQVGTGSDYHVVGVNVAFPDPFKSQEKGSIGVNLQTLECFVKKNLNLEHSRLTTSLMIFNSTALIQLFISDLIKITTYNYYLVDFVHHIVFVY